MTELLRCQCSKGHLIITESSITVTQLGGMNPRMLFRSALTGIDTKWVIFSFFGLLPSHSLTFRGMGNERLHAGLVRKKNARRIVKLLK